MPLVAHVITFYERNQINSVRVDGVPGGGVVEPDGGPDPMPPLNKADLAASQEATALLVREGKASACPSHREAGGTQKALTASLPKASSDQVTGLIAGRWPHSADAETTHLPVKSP